MNVWARVVLPAPPEVAWSFLLDWERQTAWMRDADRVTVLSPHREGVGVAIAVKTRVLGVPLFTERLEVVAWDPPRLLRLRHASFVRGHGEWRLEPDPVGSRLTWTEDLRLPIPVLGDLALAAYRPIMARVMRSSLGRLRTMFALA